MTTFRRVMALLAGLAVIAVPAAALRGSCFRGVCRPPAAEHVYVPFCSLPERTRELVVAGFQLGRSPDVVAVAKGARVVGSAGAGAPSDPVPWISTDVSATRIPIVLSGSGIGRGIERSGIGLDDVAPTLAGVMELERPDANRSGTAIPGVAHAARPRLVLEVVWKGVGTRDLRSHPDAWPGLRTMLLRGSGTLDGSTGSLPVDPAATLATLGSGGIPAEHGITGSVIRSPYVGDLVHAWKGNGTPTEIPTLADDLDRTLHQQPLIGLVGSDVADQGAIGGIYYVGSDRDAMVIRRNEDAIERSARRLLGSGFGSDDTPDLLVVVMRGGVRDLDTATHRVVQEASRASGGSLTVVVTATGSFGAADTHPDTRQVADEVEARVAGPDRAVLASDPGGMFIAPSASAHDVAQALLALRSPGDGRLMADAFPAFAVSLARFC